MLVLGATLLVGVPALIALGPALLLAQVEPQELKHWVTATGLDFATLLLVLGAGLLIAAALGMVFAVRAQRRRERQSEEGRMAPENTREVALARWIAEGRQLFNIWQERVERFDELQGRLAAMAQEIGQLSSRIDGLRAENRHLSEEGEALLVERDQLRSILARIGELIQRASEALRGPAGEATAPEVGP
jgi:FtsZ-binding cell division protein ZapB